MKYANAVVVALMALASASAMAQASGTISNGTNSNAQQAVNVNNTVAFPTGGAQQVNYSGDYTVKSAPTVYAPSLTASVTETCLGSVSAGVSVVGVGATAAMTTENTECDRRLNAAVAGRMGRMDIAFNLMCQEDAFRQASEDTDKPCSVPGAVKTGAIPPRDDKNLVPVAGTGMLQYKTAETPVPAPVAK
jgi:hypothetical protein